MERFAEHHDAAPTAGRLREVLGFGPNPGALRMLSYAPPDLRPDAPLVVVLHGCGQSAEAFAVGAGWTELADRGGFALLCPEQASANNRGLCFNWFRPADIRPRTGEAASIRQMIEHVLSPAGPDHRPVFVVGFSAGGSMALAMLATAPEVFAAGAVIAGVAYGAAANLGEALLAMSLAPPRSPDSLGDAVRRAARGGGPWPRLSVWQGLADRTVTPASADRIVTQWLNLHDLPAEPSRIEILPGQTVSHWDTAADQAVLELHRLDGLGHGAPLAVGGAEGVGQAGPFLLDAGVSSTLEIARFWGLPGLARPAAAVEAEVTGETPAARGWRAIGRRLHAIARRVLGR